MTPTPERLLLQNLEKETYLLRRLSMHVVWIAECCVVSSWGAAVDKKALTESGKRKAGSPSEAQLPLGILRGGQRARRVVE